MDISLRKAIDSDIDFLINLRDLTMAKYLADVGAPTTNTEYLKRIYYYFDDAQIVETSGAAIGLFKARYLKNKNQWYLIQIQIHPDFQNLQIGRRLIEQLIETANGQKASVGLSVLKNNPARQLYRKLGFVQVGESEFEYDMERKAQQ